MVSRILRAATGEVLTAVDSLVVIHVELGEARTTILQLRRRNFPSVPFSYCCLVDTIVYLFNEILDHVSVGDVL